MVNFTAPRSDRCPNNEPKQNNKPSDNKSNSGALGRKMKPAQPRRGSLFSGARLVSQQTQLSQKPNQEQTAGTTLTNFTSSVVGDPFRSSCETPLAPHSTKCKFYFNSYYFKRPPPFALPRLVRKKAEGEVAAGDDFRGWKNKAQHQRKAFRSFRREGGGVGLSRKLFQRDSSCSQQHMRLLFSFSECG